MAAALDNLPGLLQGLAGVGIRVGGVHQEEDVVLQSSAVEGAGDHAVVVAAAAAAAVVEAVGGLGAGPRV
jgi:hypothetical protein